jgi:CRP-like cAMP-binding protein
VTKNDILEREVFHAGHVILKAAEKSTNAYIIQSGKVVSFMLNGDRRVQVEEYGVGQIIGERNLLIELPSSLNYEALTDSTLVKLVRQDFEKKTQKNRPHTHEGH